MINSDVQHLQKSRGAKNGFLAHAKINQLARKFAAFPLGLVFNNAIWVR